MLFLRLQQNGAHFLEACCNFYPEFFFFHTIDSVDDPFDNLFQ